MKKITLLLCVFLFSFSGYSQFGPEGFENTAGPEPTPATNWTLGTGEWAVFDNGVGLDPRWDIINGTVAPLPALVHGGTTAAFMTIGNNGAGQISKDYLATPLFTVPANGQLRFWTRMFTPGNQNTIFKVGIATATANQINPAQYSFIQQWSEVQLQDTAPTVDTWIEKVVDIPATYPAGTQIYLVFSREYAQGATQTAIGGDRWLIDDVKVVSRCLDMPLASLTATNIALTTASLNWDNPSGATSWEIEIVGAAALPTGVGTVYNGIRPYPATGLTPNTNYKYYVRSICSNGALSNWIGPLNFTTLRPGLTCIAPITVPSIPYSTNDNTALYADLTDAIQGSSCGAVPAGTNFMGGNDVFYTFTPTFTGNVIVAMTPNAGVSNASMFIYQGCANVGLTCVGGVANSGTGVRKVPFLPVTAGTTYTIVLSSSVGTQAYSYGLTIQQEFCLPPQNLVVGTPIGTTTASLSWANQTGSTATSWQVAVTPAGAGIPTGPGTTTTINTNYLATGLTSGTNYQYYVRSDCGNGTFSSWTGPVQFQTALCPVSQQCNYTFIQTDAASNGWTGNVMQVKQNGIVVATLNGPTGTSGAAGSTLSTTVALCDTLPFELFWTVGGTNSTDVGISIVNSFGQTIKTKPAGVGTNNSIVYSGVVNCITPACIAPINLTATAISNTSATLGWFTAGPETSWQVLVVPRGTPAPTAATVGWQTATTNPFIYTPLISGTNYTFYVRPVCSPTNVGDWSDGLNFTSSICPLANKCNYQFLMSDSASNGWGSTMSVVQNGIVVATLSGPTTGNATLNQNVSL